MVNHRQVTPGDSLKVSSASLRKSAKAAPAARRQLRKGTEGAATAAAVALATSNEGSRGLQGTETKVKKSRKPRRSSKKTTTAGQVAAKRETFLKRNREAAYKCRVKKKTQTEKDVEMVKTIGEDNAARLIEVESLRGEVKWLRGLLLPHYRGCEDKRVVAYLDGLGCLGEGCGGMGEINKRQRAENEPE